MAHSLVVSLPVQLPIPSSNHLLPYPTPFLPNLSAFLRNEVAWYDLASNSSGSLAGRLSSSATLVRASITDRTSVAVQNLSLVIVAFGVAFALCWRMALATLATFPLLVLSTSCEQAFYQVHCHGNTVHI